MIHTQTCYIKFLQAKLKENQKKRNQETILAFPSLTFRADVHHSSPGTLTFLLLLDQILLFATSSCQALYLGTRSCPFSVQVSAQMSLRVIFQSTPSHPLILPSLLPSTHHLMQLNYLLTCLFVTYLFSFLEYTFNRRRKPQLFFLPPRFQTQDRALKKYCQTNRHREGRGS